MALEAIGIGDLHLTDDKGQGGLAKYIENPDRYVMSEVKRIVEWGINRHITEVWFYGDFCQNPRMSYEGMKAFARLIRSYPDVTFRGILGNHDKITETSSDGHSMEIIKDYKLPNFILYEVDTEVTVQGAKIKFCPWPSIETNSKCLNVVHKEVNGSLSDSGREMKDETLSSSKDVIVAGHLHTKHRVRNSYFSGTIYQTNFGEGLAKYFHHIVFANPKDYEITEVPFKPKYRLHNVVIETEADLDNLSRDPRDLLKVAIKDGVNLSLPDLPNIVVSKAYKTKEELRTILTEDLIEGSELVIRSEDFFDHWLANLNATAKLKKHTSTLRKEILNGHGSK